MYQAGLLNGGNRTDSVTWNLEGLIIIIENKWSFSYIAGENFEYHGKNELFTKGSLKMKVAQILL